MSRVIMTVGCAGSGKMQLARALDPQQWAVLCFDDFRAAMFGTYRAGECSKQMKGALQDAYINALRSCIDAGLNVCLPNMHLRWSRFSRTMGVLRREGITAELAVFAGLSFGELVARNAAKPEGERVDLEKLRAGFDQLHAPDAWWKSWRGKTEILPYPELRHAA